MDGVRLCVAAKVIRLTSPSDKTGHFRRKALATAYTLAPTTPQWYSPRMYTSSSNNRSVFHTAPFRVLATMLLVEAVLIGQALSRGAGQAKPELNPNADNPCSNFSPPDGDRARACWRKSAMSGDKNLSNAYFPGVNLAKVNLSKANLGFANLEEANLSGANLTGAGLGNAKLTRANLSGANLTKARCSYVDAAFANLSGADLTGANFVGARLLNANLTKANLTGANFIEAILLSINVQVKLTGANLTGANFTRAKLGIDGCPRIPTGADLSEADLSGANFTGADLSGANLKGIKKDAKTKGLPPGV